MKKIVLTYDPEREVVLHDTSAKLALWSVVAVIVVACSQDWAEVGSVFQSMLLVNADIYMPMT